MAGTIIPVAVLAVVYGVLGIIVWRRPLLGRLAVREAIRRPGQSALLVFGMMFGTAAILAMQGVLDSFVNINDTIILLGWGRTDITVTQQGEVFDSKVAREIALDPRVAAGAAGVQGGFVLLGSASDSDRRLSTSPVQLVSFDPAQPGFGTFALQDGRTTDGSSLGADGAIVSSTLATRLQAHVGDSIQVNFAEGGHIRQLNVRVAGITKVGGSGVLAQQPGIFVSLGAIQAVVGAGTVNLVRVSAKGDGTAEVDNARALAPAVRAAVASLPAAGALSVREVKAEDLATSRAQTANSRPLGLALSLFVVLAATALVVNLTLALAEERRPRLAVLRALGLTRSGMIAAALLEGALYSLAAGVVGILPGVAYIYVVDARPVGPDNGLVAANGISAFAVTPTSISLSVCLGVLVTLATILVVSVRNSRMAISSAIRDLPDPASRRHPTRFGTLWPLVLAVVGVAALFAPGIGVRLLGGAALIVAASRVARDRVPERVRASFTGAALVAWPAVVILGARGSIDFGPVVLLGTVALVICVFGLAILLSANLRVLELATWLFSGRLVATIRPPLAYMTRRPVRSGLATGAFALVLASLTFFAVIIPSVGPDTRTISYDVLVRTLGADTFTLPESLRSQVVDMQSLSTLAYVGPVKEDQATQPSSGWRNRYSEFYPLTPEQLSRPPVVLVQRDSRYSSDAAVWQAIRDDPSLVVGTVGGLGHVTLIGHSGEVRLHIIGLAAGVIFASQVANGYIGTQSTFADLSASGAGSTVLIKTAPGVDPTAFTLSLRHATFGQGVDAISAQEIADGVRQGVAWFVGFFTLLLQAGVIVGVISLGILALRAAIERRRVIGLMRALGYLPGQVLSGLLVEATVTVTIGIAVGIGVGLAIGSLVLHGAAATTGNTTFVGNSIDVGEILVPALLIYITVWLVTIGPALRASRLPAAEALRIVG